MSNKKISAKVDRQKKLIKVGLIGCGQIGFGYDQGKQKQNPLSYFSVFYHHKAFQLSAIVEPNSKLRLAIAKKFKVKTYDSYNEMLATEKLAVIIIASPDHTHAAIVKAAIKQKPKLIICEKPLALTTKEIKELTTLCQKNKIGLMVNFSRRFMPGFIGIKKIITEKQLGQLQNVTIHYSRGLKHNGSHYLDLLLWYFGQPTKIMVEKIRPGLLSDDPTISCVLIYKDFEVRLIGQETSNLLINEIDIIGNKGRITIDTFGQAKFFTIGRHKPYQQYLFYKESKQLIFNQLIALAALRDNVLAYLNRQAELSSPAKNSLAVAKLIDKIHSYGKLSS